MPDFAVLFEKFAANILTSAISQTIVDELGVSISTLRRLGIGFNPTNGAFIFPERDEHGEIIGLCQRFKNGKKRMYKGSKRGLIYEVSSSFLEGGKYVPGKHNWIRLHEAGVDCPICGKPDWCLVSAINPEKPAAVVCSRISKGSVTRLKGCGFLHVLDPEGNKSHSVSQVLPDFKGPILVTEGYSDTASALDMGFMAIGKPSAEFNAKALIPLVKDQDVIIVGDNDAGAGKQGLDNTFDVLEPICKSTVKVLPPEKYKDLRHWRNQIQIDKNTFLQWVIEHGESDKNPNILKDAAPATVAKAWLKKKIDENGIPSVRSYKGQWVRFKDGCYRPIDPSVFRGNIYKYLEDKSYPRVYDNGKIEIKPFQPTRAKISDVMDALNQWCPIDCNPPCWLKDTDLPGPEDLIIFKNGILDVKEYMQGRIKLHNPDPAFFTFNALPYAFDEDAESKLFETDFLPDIFDYDEEKTRLLGQWFGYNCVPDMSLEKLMLCTGRPRSGKGTVINALGAMLGRDQYAATSLRAICRRFGTQPLVGKLAVLMSDVRVSDFATSQAASEILLHIVGGDPIGIERKHVANLSELFLTCRFTLATNGILNIRDDEDALRGKINILHFAKSFAGREDFSLKARIQAEAEQGKLINFALRGLKDLRECGKFIIPKSSRPILKSLRDINTPIFTFIGECCELAPPETEGHYVHKDTLFEAWVEWCRINGHKPDGSTIFGRHLLTHFPNVTAQRIRIDPDKSKHMRPTTKRAYVYENIRLTDEACRKYLI